MISAIIDESDKECKKSMHLIMFALFIYCYLITCVDIVSLKFFIEMIIIEFKRCITSLKKQHDRCFFKLIEV